MAFAIFYEDGDREAIATQLTRSDLPEELQPEAAKYWNGGFYEWAVCPFGPYDRLPSKILVVDGTDCTVAGLIALLRAIADAFTDDIPATYMASIADDLESEDENGYSSSRLEPWTGM